jgi:hypothetical protein
MAGKLDDLVERARLLEQVRGPGTMSSRFSQVSVPKARRLRSMTV